MRRSSKVVPATTDNQIQVCQGKKERQHGGQLYCVTLSITPSDTASLGKAASIVKSMQSTGGVRVYKGKIETLIRVGNAIDPDQMIQSVITDVQSALDLECPVAMSDDKKRVSDAIDSEKYRRDPFSRKQEVTIHPRRIGSRRRGH